MDEPPAGPWGPALLGGRAALRGVLPVPSSHCPTLGPLFSRWTDVRRARQASAPAQASLREALGPDGSAVTGLQRSLFLARCFSDAPGPSPCLVERVRPALRPHRTVSSSGRELGHRGTLAPEGSSKHPGCLFIIRRKTLLRRRMTDRWCQRARPCCLRGRRPNDDSVRGVA